MTACARPGCDGLVERAATGRPRTFCSGRCRQAAYRERHRVTKLPHGLTAAALAKGTAPDALRVGARPLEARELLAPLAAAGLVERRGRVWRLTAEAGPFLAAARSSFVPLEPEDGDGLPRLRRGPALGTPRPPRERVAVAA